MSFQKLSTYMLAVHTGQIYAPTEYDMAAGRLLTHLSELLSSQETIGDLTYSADRATCHSEIEASHDADGLQARVVIDVMSIKPVKFNKSLFSKLVKNEEWPNMRTSKRQLMLKPTPEIPPH